MLKLKTLDAFFKVQGWNVTRSWIIAHLFTEGIQNMELTEPIEDIIVRDNECVTLRDLQIKLIGKDW